MNIIKKELYDINGKLNGSNKADNLYESNNGSNINLLKSSYNKISLKNSNNNFKSIISDRKNDDKLHLYKDSKKSKKYSNQRYDDKIEDEKEINKDIKKEYKLTGPDGKGWGKDRILNEEEQKMFDDIRKEEIRNENKIRKNIVNQNCIMELNEEFDNEEKPLWEKKFVEIVQKEKERLNKKYDKKKNQKFIEDDK